nr:glycosyltransferase [Shewanella sp. Isolate11]
MLTKKVDVIFLHSAFAGLVRPIIYPLCKIKSIKVVYCSHGWSFNRKNSGGTIKISSFFYKYIELSLSLFVNQIVCISSSEYHDALDIGISTKKLKLIWNGVRESNTKELITNNSKFKFLFVGRFDEQKGLDLLLQSILKLPTGIKDSCKLILVGESVLSQSHSLYCEELINTVSDDIEIEKLGWVKNSEIDIVYKSCDVLIVPSRWEGFGLVVAEALRNNRPVIASNVDSFPQMVVNNETGWIFESCDLNDLSKKLELSFYKARAIIGTGRCLDSFNRCFNEKIMNQKLFNLFVRK